MVILKKTKKLATIFVASAILFVVNEHIIASSVKTPSNLTIKPNIDTLQSKEEMDVDWGILTNAIINIESGGNDTISGPTNDLGCIQATPIYVEEANRICRLKGIDKVYTLEDRKSRKKSIEMFNIIQSFHNKSRCIVKAAKLHNPGAGQAYVDKVIKEYNKLKSNN